LPRPFLFVGVQVDRGGRYRELAKMIGDLVEALGGLEQKKAA